MREPIFPKPNYVSSIWGGHRLTDIRGITAPKDNPYGICREVCAYKKAENFIEGGSFNGISLKALIESHHTELMGSNKDDQLIRIAYIDAVEDLSIQVHPNEEYAKREEEDYEKSECWYILDAEEDAYIVAGTTTKDIDLLKKAAEQDKIEAFVQKIPIRKGDFAMIPCGMLHACGKNMLAIEIGSFGGITYRLCDYGRGRELHLKQGFDVLDPSLICQVKHFEPGARPTHGGVVSPAIHHPLFKVDVIDITDHIKINKADTYHTLTAVEGNATLVIHRQSYPLPFTHTAIVPAALEEYELLGNCRVLCCYP